MMRTETRTTVAEAWRQNQALTRGDTHTDGQQLYSYAHRVGDTIEGQKVAYCCHYSPTTAKHCSAFKRWADVILACPSHSRAECQSCRTTLPVEN